MPEVKQWVNIAVPLDLLDALDAEAKRLDRSRRWVILDLLSRGIIKRAARSVVKQNREIR